jgi:hypothetical protein
MRIENADPAVRLWHCSVCAVLQASSRDRWVLLCRGSGLPEQGDGTTKILQFTSALQFAVTFSVTTFGAIGEASRCCVLVLSCHCCLPEVRHTEVCSRKCDALVNPMVVIPRNSSDLVSVSQALLPWQAVIESSCTSLCLRDGRSFRMGGLCCSAELLRACKGPQLPVQGDHCRTADSCDHADGVPWHLRLMAIL